MDLALVQVIESSIVTLIGGVFVFFTWIKSEADKKIDRDNNLVNWSWAVIAKMAEFREIIKFRDLSQIEKAELCASFSALTDQGRFFFKNIKLKNVVDDGFQRGLRSAILDEVMFHYRVVENITLQSAVKNELIADLLKSQFVFVNLCADSIVTTRKPFNAKNGLPRGVTNRVLVHFPDANDD